jgi:AcrR family transcriptional regulator
MNARRRIDASTLPEAPPPLAHLTLHSWQVVCVARTQLERDGISGLSLHSIAGELGISTPSLYRHITSKYQLEMMLIAWGLWQHGSATQAALLEPGDPLWNSVQAHRAFALANSQLYELMNSRSVDDPLLRDAEHHTRIAMMESVDAPMPRRVIWPFIHGLVLLESSNRIPQGWDIEAMWRAGVEALRGAE